MKALVTGGGGFLGGAIVRRLVERGDSVRSLARHDYAWQRDLGVESVRGDLLDPTAVNRAAADCDVVFHVAAKTGIWGSFRDYFAANVEGTKNVVAACRAGGVPRLVYTSSPSVVFDGRDMEGVNESVPYAVHYEAAYPATKAQAERLALAGNGSDLAVVALRPHLIWGPGDTSLLPRIIARARAGRLRRIGRSPKLVDSTYIDDAVSAHLLAADRLGTGSPVSGGAYFISQGEPLPLWELINGILAVAGLPPVTRTVPFWTAFFAAGLSEAFHRVIRIDSEPPLTRFIVRELATAHWFDITAARRDLGYAPSVTIDEGLRRLGQWLQGTGPDSGN
jgi:nucleoside-diphosphate-sugar epimerase